MRQAIRYVWALPTSLLGAVFVPLALISGGGVRWVAGALEVYGGAVRWLLRHCPLLQGGALALTLGHVVLGVDPQALDVTRRHERVHVAQCERWGPFFVPAYLLAGVWALVRGGHPYRDNRFEREASVCGQG